MLLDGDFDRGNACRAVTSILQPASLVYEFPKHQNGVPINVFLAKIGGAVFTFKYTLAGDHRTLITYFSESTIKEQILAGGG